MSDSKTATVTAYDRFADAYAEATPDISDATRVLMEEVVARLPAGAQVLDVGSGSGRDALALEAHGLVVQRTDITPGFVRRLRGQGHDARVLDPLHDDLGGPYDAVWANASLLHVQRADLPTVLRRLHDAVRPGGLLGATFKEGDGDGWTNHGAVRAPRHYTFWRAADLARVVEDAGWSVDSSDTRDGTPGFERWITVVAHA